MSNFSSNCACADFAHKVNEAYQRYLRKSIPFTWCLLLGMKLSSEERLVAVIKSQMQSAIKWMRHCGNWNYNDRDKCNFRMCGRPRPESPMCEFGDWNFNDREKRGMRQFGGSDGIARTVTGSGSASAEIGIATIAKNAIYENAVSPEPI